MFKRLAVAAVQHWVRRWSRPQRWLGLLALSVPLAWAGPHEHGVVYLDLAREGATLTAQLRAPLESLIGFERAPRTAAERQAASALLEHLRQDGALLQTDAAAGCALQSVEIKADVLQGRTQNARGGHAELLADYRWHCDKPDQLRAATVQLFERYRRTRKVEVQVAMPQGQTRVTLRPASHSVALAR
jgi:hypothetical protein